MKININTHKHRFFINKKLLKLFIINLKNIITLKTQVFINDVCNTRINVII
jgi:hypothetical protein